MLKNSRGRYLEICEAKPVIHNAFFFGKLEVGNRLPPLDNLLPWFRSDFGNQRHLVIDYQYRVIDYHIETCENIPVLHM
jgi:hypothetical protein